MRACGCVASAHLRGVHDRLPHRGRLGGDGGLHLLQLGQQRRKVVRRELREAIADRHAGGDRGGGRGGRGLDRHRVGAATGRRRQREIGELKIKISGCINACGHHHVGHIGILGVEKKGEEFYQLTLGGSGDETASVGEIIGPGFSYDDVVGAVETLVETYLKVRSGPDESFLAAYRRLGQAPFKEALYGAA